MTAITQARNFIAGLMDMGRYTFPSPEAEAAIDASPETVKLVLAQLIQQGLLASPARGFYVTVPLEYRSLGCLPADHFISALMAEKAQPYYTGLLSAAHYHGAIDRPREFQVLVTKARRQIACGKVLVSFIVKRGVETTAIQKISTARGRIAVSTPEATALDLVGYYKNAGGMDNVTGVLAKLAAHLDADKLALAAASAPMSWAQRLGYILTRLGHARTVRGLQELVSKAGPQMIQLLPRSNEAAVAYDSDWQLRVNATIDSEN